MIWIINSVESLQVRERASTSRLTTTPFQIAPRTRGEFYNYDSKSQRVVSDYRYFYYYDNNGNLTSKQGIGLTGEVTNYSYSSENQLLSVYSYVPASGYNPSQLWIPNSQLIQEIHYAYDAMGRRIHKSVTNYTAPTDPNQTFTRSYVYDGGNILLEFDGSNDLLARYTHSLATDDELAVSVRNVSQGSNPIGTPGSYQFLKDGQGSIVDIADTNGNRLQTALYSAYGTRLALKNGAGVDISNSPVLRTTYAFAGRELDPETGLYYNRARYYDSTIGRFLQKDPAPGSLFMPASVVNSYAYSANNPQNVFDPSGMSWLSDHIGGIVAGVEAAITIIGIVVSIVTADPAVTIVLSSDLAAETTVEGGAALIPMAQAAMGAGDIAATGVLAGAAAVASYSDAFAAAATTASMSVNATAASVQAAALSAAPTSIVQPVSLSLATDPANANPRATFDKVQNLLESTRQVFTQQSSSCWHITMAGLVALDALSATPANGATVTNNIASQPFFENKAIADENCSVWNLPGMWNPYPF